MRVLLIEDEPTTAKAIELMLTTEGFNVYTTDLGEEGLDLRVLPSVGDERPLARLEGLVAPQRLLRDLELRLQSRELLGIERRGGDAARSTPKASACRGGECGN